MRSLQSTALLYKRLNIEVRFPRDTSQVYNQDLYYDRLVDEIIMDFCGEKGCGSAQVFIGIDIDKGVYKWSLTRGVLSTP